MIDRWVIETRDAHGALAVVLFDGLECEAEAFAEATTPKGRYYELLSVRVCSVCEQETCACDQEAWRPS